MAIVVVTDEDDCSIRNTDIGWWALDVSHGLTRGSAACEEDPNDPCCYACGMETPAGCTPKEQDAACALGERISVIDEFETTGLNVRCVDQKRRYGYDYLHSISRYVDGLSAPELPLGHDALGEPLRDARGEIAVAPNPLFFAPDGTSSGRTPDQVIFTGIVGVPWHDLATDETLDAGKPLELLAPEDYEAAGVYPLVLGTGEAPPVDPFSRSSTEPRTGVIPALASRRRCPSARARWLGEPRGFGNARIRERASPGARTLEIQPRPRPAPPGERWAAESCVLSTAGGNPSAQARPTLSTVAPESPFPPRTRWTWRSRRGCGAPGHRKRGWPRPGC